MEREMVKIHTAKPHYYFGEYEVPKNMKPNIHRTYIKILAKCTDYTTTHQIYPHTRNVMPDQLYILENAGLLERFTERRWSHLTSRWPRTWWKTTTKGMELVCKTLAKAYDQHCI